MFGRGCGGRRQMAFAWEGGYGPGGYEGWQPWAHEERGEREGWGPGFGHMMWHMARRFPFGPGMHGMGPRMFGRGDLKYALLEALRERPKHGYEMIKELEERASGFYTPSAGAVYPTLQLLEDRGWVTSQTVEGKRVYTITDAGREALGEYQERGETFGGPFGRHARPELRAIRHESMEVARLMRAAVLASDGDPERLAQLRAIVEQTRAALDEFLGQRRPAGSGGEGAGPAAPGRGPEGQA